MPRYSWFEQVVAEERGEALPDSPPKRRSPAKSPRKQDTPTKKPAAENDSPGKRKRSLQVSPKRSSRSSSSSMDRKAPDATPCKEDSQSRATKVTPRGGTSKRRRTS